LTFPTFLSEYLFDRYGINSGIYLIPRNIRLTFRRISISISFHNGTDRRWRTCTCVQCQTQDTSFSSDQLRRLFSIPLNDHTRVRISSVLSLWNWWDFADSFFDIIMIQKKVILCVHSVEMWTCLKLFRVELLRKTIIFSCGSSWKLHVVLFLHSDAFASSLRSMQQSRQFVGELRLTYNWECLFIMDNEYNNLIQLILDVSMCIILE